MSSLQKSFKYEGNVAVAPFKAITLNFEIPAFEFISTTLGNKPFIERKEIGIEQMSVYQSLLKNEYFLNIPNEVLTGAAEISCINFWKYLSQIGFSNKASDILGSISVNYSVQVSDDNENVFENIAQKAVYSIATSSDKYWKLIGQLQVTRGRDILDEEAEKNLELELADYIKENTFLLNKAVLKEVAAAFRNIMPSLNDYAFLYVVSHLTNLSSGRPVIEIDTLEIKTFLHTHFEIDNAATVKSIVQLIKKNFNRFFDFSITVPEIKTVEVKGTFKIVTSDSTAVNLSDFNFYDLAVEYSTRINENESQPVSVNFNWSNMENAELSNSTVPFSFAALITNALDGPIRVSVKGYDGSLLWEEEFAVANPVLQELKIKVRLLKPMGINTSGQPQPVAGNKKLHGKLVEMTGECELKGVTVLVQVKKTNDTVWKVVGVALTDGAGNFSMPYPYGIYSSAQAIVSLTPNSPAEIPILTDTQHLALNETIADDFLYLLLKDVVCEPKNEEEDCDCHQPKKSNRLPDQEQLINSDDYTQDIGGSCINLSTPNRTLNEYSHKAVIRTSDPDVANYKLDKNENGVFRLKGGHTKINRRKINLHNPIRWQDAPDNKNNLSFYQAVTVATGHILHYKVSMKADGYSMGELLYSLPLAPGQKKQIVMFDQTHTLLGSETQRLSQRENLAASLLNDIDIADTLGGSINENTSGSSSASTSGVSGGLGLAGIIEGVAATLGVAGGFANANSTASQSSSRQIAQHFQEQMRNGITQNAQSYREQNASVITTVQEGQEYGVTTEVVANHNHCHSLTMMYFEVLRHYAIYQELTQVEECLFIPLLMTEFSKENIYKWRDVLAKHLLPMPSETYLQPFTAIKSGRQHPLLRAFDAIERRKTEYKHVDFPEGAYDDEIINFVTGEMYIQTNLPRPKTTFDRIQSWPVIEKEEGSNWSWKGAVAGAILKGPLGAIAGGILAADGVTITQDAAKIINEYITIDANYRSLPPAKAIRVIKFDNHFFEEGGNDKKQWLAYSNLLGKSLTDMLEYYFKDRLIAEWDSIFYNDIAPVLFEKIVEKIKIGTFSALDFSSESKYKGGSRLMRINIRGNGSNKKRKEIESLKIELNTISNINLGLFDITIPMVYRLTSDLITLNVNRLTIRYSTPHYSGILYSGGLGNDDLIDGTEILTPENENEKRNPRKEDQYLALKLIEHLNSYLEHYNKVLWRNLDADRRYMLLDGFKIETYNEFGQPAGFRSLASVIKNELVGIAGNALIMPVAPGYKIDRSYIVEQPAEGAAKEINLFEVYKPLTPAPPYRISIPSKGIFAEAVQGACDACEKVKENTSQDWEKFKTDEPTAINPVTTPVPVVTDWKAAFKDFATPIVNIQNAPAAPTPGAGLAGLSELLGKSDVFRDATGLDGNQKNALQTYLSNQQNAKDFAQMAKDIFTIDHNAKHSDAIAESIRNADELSDQEKAELLKKHYNQVIDGGQSEKAAQEAAAKKNDPSAMGIVADAVNQGKAAKGSKIDAAGNSETVEVGPGSVAGGMRVTGTTYWVSQGDKTNVCWAATAAMMKSWKDHKKYSIEDVLKLTPPEYLEKYNKNELLLVAEKDDFIAALNMVSEPPASYTFNHYIDWLEQYGPLWITVDTNTATDSISPHAIVLIGYDGDGTESNSQFVFYDPGKTGEQKEYFGEFDEKYSQVAFDNPGALMTQIVHFKDRILGEGAAQTPAYWQRRKPDSNRANNIAKEALAKLNSFRYSITNPSWTKMNQQALFSKLVDLVENPLLVNQLSTPLCGSAAFFMVWIDVDPEAFVDFAIKLYRDGKSNIGTRVVEPQPVLLTTDLSAIATANNRPVSSEEPYGYVFSISEAEWMLFSSLECLTVDAALLINYQGYTSGKEIEDYFSAAGLYQTASFRDYSISEINEKMKSNGNKSDVVINLHSQILPPGVHDTANNSGHYVIQFSEFYRVSGDTSNYYFDYWCWGALNAADGSGQSKSAKITEDEFENRIFGFLINERKDAYWYLFPGEATEIATGGNSIFVLGTASGVGGHPIFKGDGSGWSTFGGSGLKIAVTNDDKPVVVNDNGDVLMYDGNQWITLPAPVTTHPSNPGKATDVFFGLDKVLYSVWVNPAYPSTGTKYFKWNGTAWDITQSLGVKFCVDAASDVWCIDDSNNIWKSEGRNQYGAFIWKQLPGQAQHISIGADGSVWIIGLTVVTGGFEIHKWADTKWEKVKDKGGVKVAVDKTGKPIIIVTNNKIYQRKPVPPKTSL